MHCVKLDGFINCFDVYRNQLFDLNAIKITASISSSAFLDAIGPKVAVLFTIRHAQALIKSHMK